MIDSTDNDPIIKKLLSTRQHMQDCSPSDEAERQRRMYNMLRWSTKYKKIQVNQANTNWVSQNTLQLPIDNCEVGSQEYPSLERGGLKGLSQIMRLSDETHDNEQKCSCVDGPCDRFVQIRKCQLDSIQDLTFDNALFEPPYEDERFSDASLSAIDDVLDKRKVRFNEDVDYIPNGRKSSKEFVNGIVAYLKVKLHI